MKTEFSAITQGIEEVYDLLQDKPEMVGRLFNITSLAREDFQSYSFQAAGHQFLPDVYGSFDRSIWRASFSDNTQLFIITGKVTDPGRPYELGAADSQGIDLRRISTSVAEWDGNETIIIHSPEGIEVITGEFGKPEELLKAARATLGELVGEVSFL